MNKILNINLGGYAFTIDDDAYEYLSAYLDSIRRRFSESEGRDEIVHDIEMRLGELISQDMGSRTIVMLPDVEAAVQIMGKPEEFGGEPAEQPRRSTASGKSAGSIRTGKRLFRDEEDSVAGGVCSGLSAYFGFADPVWIRLLFVLFTFLSFGIWAPAYLLLWILVPPARTATDRLVMRGEPVNADNIAREIEDGFERISSKVNEFGASAKKKGMSGGQNAFSTLVSAIGQIFAFAVRFFVKFGALIAICVGIGLFIALTVGWVASIWSLFAAAPYVDFFSPYSNGVTWLGFANLFFLLGIPLIGLCLVFSRVLFKTRAPGWLGSSLSMFWVLNLVCGIVLVGLAAGQYRSSGTLNKPIDLSGIRSDTLRIEAAGIPADYEDDDWWFHGEGVRINEDQMEMSGPVEILVRPGDSGRFECVETIKARGASSSNAAENAASTEFNIVTEGNVLRIPTSYSILKGKKWRVQEVKIKIAIPVGKYVVFGKYINDHARSSDYADMDDGPYIRDYPDRVFRMTDRGLVCTDCPQFGEKNYRGDDRYENFIFEGDFNAEIREGDNFRIEMEGASSDRDAIQTIRSGEKITFTTNGKTTNGKVKIIITAPVFTSLHADNTGEVTIRGFREGDASISAKGNSRIKAYLDASNELNLSLSGKCSVELTGKGRSLNANLTDGAILEASNWRAEEAEISASNGSKARANVNREAVVKSDSDSKINIEGNAEVKENKEN